MFKTNIKVLGVILAFFFFSNLILHAENNDLLFYASFDKGFNADVAKGGNPVAMKPSFLRLVPGIKGKAVLVKGAKDIVQYSGAGCVNGAQGTFIVWVKPIDWTPSTKNFVFFAGASAVSGSDRHDLWMFKNWKTSNIQFLARKRNTKKGTSAFAKAQSMWKTGSWHQLAISWNGKLYKYYIDGKEEAVRGGPEMPDIGWDKIKVGFFGGSWPSIGNEATAIDELRIWKNQLSAEEISTEYNKMRGVLKKQTEFKTLSLKERASFYVPFDNSLDNISEFKGNRPAKIRGGSGQTEYIPGVIKKAVILNGPEKLRVHYSMAKKIKSPSGTCSIWVKPVDWNSSDKKMQFFVSFFSKNSRVFLYRTKNKNSLSLVFQNTKNTKQTATVEKQIDWVKGKWYNLTFTWDKIGYALYINGEIAGTRSAVEVSNIWKDLYVGTSMPSWGNSVISTGKTAFDQWVILPYVMSDNEIKKQYVETIMGKPELKDLFVAAQLERDFKAKNNLAQKDRGCYVLTSSFANYRNNYSDKLLDGKANSVWKAKDTEPSQWIELHWPTPVKMNKIVLIRDPECKIVDYKIKARIEDKWVDVKQSKVNTGSTKVEIKFPVTDTNVLRVYLNKGKELSLAEIEAYGPLEPSTEGNRAYWTANYVWYPEARNAYIANSPRYFRKEFDIKEMNFKNAYVQSRSNDGYIIYINGHKVSSGSTIIKPSEVTKYLKKGVNVIAAIAELRSNPGRWGFGEFLTELSINYPGESKRIGTDKSWKSFDKKVSDWNNVGFDDSSWKNVASFGPPPSGPWGDIPYSYTAVRESVPIKGIKIEPANAKPGQKVRVSMTLQPKLPVGRDYFFVYQIGEKIIDERMGSWVIAKGTFKPKVGTSKSGKTPVVISTELYLPEYTPGGKLPVRVEAFDYKTGIQLDFVNNGKKTDLLGYINVAKRPSKKPLSELATAKVSFPNNQSAFEINGKIYPPYYWKNHWITNPSRYYYENKGGINIFHFTLHGHIVDAESKKEESRKHYFGVLDQQLDHFVRTCPDSWIMLQVDLRPTSPWLKENPDERLINAFGQKGPVCYASKKYMNDSLEAMDAFFNYFKDKPYYNRIVMIQPLSLGKMDSGLGGCGMNRFQTDRSKLTVGDYNPQAIEMFRDFLRKKYKNSVKALRAAWKKPAITFATAFPHLKELVAESADGGAFRDPSKGCMPFDYAEFLPHILSNWYKIMAAKIKKETNRRTMVFIHYGYILTQLRAYNTPGDVWNNNDYDFSELLECDDIDGYIGAPDYSNRMAEHSYMLYFPFSSIRLHKKLYTPDGDYRTFVAKPTMFGRHRGTRESRAILQRDIGGGICRNIGSWLSDMSNGAFGTRSAHPWFTEESISKTIREMMQLYRKSIDVGYQKSSEVALIFSTDQPHFSDLYHSTTMLNNLIGQTYFKEIGKLGAPYDIYMLDDLRHPDMKDYKLYIVFNPFYLKEKDRQALENLKKDGKTILWLYAPDYIDKENGLVTENISKITGINVKKKAGKEHMWANVTDTSHPITSYVRKNHNIRVVDFSYPISAKMYPKEFSPVFYVDDSKAKVLARYKNDNKAALAVRDFGNWKSVYCAVPRLDKKMLRGIAKYAGVNIYVEDNMNVDANRNFVVISNDYKKDKDITVNLPSISNVSDALTGESIAKNVKAFKTNIPKCNTKLFFIEPLSK
jgi:Concanavalin A-like lectin/glucanases superfamily/F5/8 type C domain